MTAPDPRVGEPRDLIAFATECADPNWSLSIPPVAKDVITRLLAELRDREGKLARVEELCAATDTETDEALQADLVARIRAAGSAAGGTDNAPD